MNNMKKEDIKKIILGIVVFIVLILLLILIFKKRGFNKIINKELACKNQTIQSRYSSVEKFTKKEHQARHENVDEPLISNYKIEKVDEKKFEKVKNKKNFKITDDFKDAKIYKYVLDEVKQKTKDGKTIVLDKDVEYYLLINKDNKVLILNDSKHINKLCEIKKK